MAKSKLENMNVLYVCNKNLKLAEKAIFFFRKKGYNWAVHKDEDWVPIGCTAILTRKIGKLKLIKFTTSSYQDIPNNYKEHFIFFEDELDKMEEFLFKRKEPNWQKISWSF